MTSNVPTAGSRAATMRRTARSTFASSLRPAMITERLRVGPVDVGRVLMEGVVVADGHEARELPAAEVERVAGARVVERRAPEIHVVGHQVEGDPDAAEVPHAPHRRVDEGAPRRRA